MANAFGNAFNKSRDNSPLRITKKSSTGSVRSRADSLSIGSPIGRAIAKKINGAKDVIMRTQDNTEPVEPFPLKDWEIQHKFAPKITQQVN